MPVRRDHLLLHLELLREAYGADLPLELPLRPPPRRHRPKPEAPQRPVPQRRPAPRARRSPSPRETTRPDSTTQGTDRLDALRREVQACTKCRLCETRQRVVFGEGDPDARVLFVGEAPGAREDETGRPFVGPAGELLERILNKAMGLRREEVFIANVNKCRPPNNRNPRPDEVAACLPFLQRQVERIAPDVIVCLGRVAAQNLLDRTESASRLRGMELDYRGTPVVVTWHPAFLLRDPSRKAETWEDIKRVNRLLGRPEVPPPVG